MAFVDGGEERCVGVVSCVDDTVNVDQLSFFQRGSVGSQSSDMANSTESTNDWCKEGVVPIAVIHVSVIRKNPSCFGADDGSTLAWLGSGLLSDWETSSNSFQLESGTMSRKFVRHGECDVVEKKAADEVDI